MAQLKESAVSRVQGGAAESFSLSLQNDVPSKEQRLWVQAAQPLAAAVCAWMLRSGAWFIGTGGRLVFGYQARTLLLSFSNV